MLCHASNWKKPVFYMRLMLCCWCLFVFLPNHSSSWMCGLPMLGQERATQCGSIETGTKPHWWISQWPFFFLLAIIIIYIQERFTPPYAPHPCYFNHRLISGPSYLWQNCSESFSLLTHGSWGSVPKWANRVVHAVRPSRASRRECF